MSLMVHLPLNGNLNNNGLLDVIVTNHGATVENNGKIGKCYAFDNNTSYIALQHINLYSILNGAAQPFSICFWVYQADASRAIIFGDYSVSGGNNFNIELTTGHTLRWYWGTPDFSISAMNVGLEVWVHVAFTYDGTTLKGYLNGLLKYTGTYTLAAKGRTAGEYYLGRDGRTGTTTLNGRLNDFRIYDHCLSNKEVKEISKGLVLHYKLDDPYIESTTNLASTGAGGWNNSGTCTRTTNDTTILNPPTSSNTYSVRATSDGSMALTCGFTPTNMPSKTIVASVYVWLDGTQDSSSFYLRSQKTDGSVGNLMYNGNANPSTWPQRKWIRIYTNVITTASDATTFYICTYIDKNTEVRAVNGWQIEEKDHPTPWTAPGTTRANEIIEDSSGYNHNGTINSLLTVSSNTARYSSSTSFDGVDDCIQIPFNDMIKNKNYTISVWTYKTSIGTKNYQTILGGPGGFELEARSGATADPLYRIYNWGGGTTSYEFNKWNLFTFVHTDSDSKLYVNGELKITGSSANIPTGNYYIGAWGSVTGQNYEGKMSDFRIYATDLSADDVKELYNIPAMIDSKQNLYGYEFVESMENRELLNSVLITSSYGEHTTPINNSKYINGELTFTTNGSSAGSPYIPITPSGHVYKYDIEFSVNAGNLFYIGFERYDLNKTPRSNNACAYVYTTKSTTNLSHKRIKGTVNLSTDGTNPCAFIALRILNGWSGTDSGVTGTATIHRLSLLEVSSTMTATINKLGICIADNIYEDTETTFYDNGYIESNQFIEY